MTVRDTCGLPITRTSLEEAVDGVCELAASGQSADIHFLSAHSISITTEDPEYRQVIQQGSTVLPDSRWLQFLTSWSATPLTQVRGPDFFRALLNTSSVDPIGHFFVAPNDRVADRLLEAIHREYPRAHVTGHIVAPQGPFTEAQIRQILEQIRALGQPIVWLGIGTPAQNFLARRLAELGGGIVIGVGAAFEFVAGIKSEAPRWMSTVGIEWLFRFVTEPRRLWHRYTVGNLKFLSAFFAHELGLGKSEKSVPGT